MRLRPSHTLPLCPQMFNLGYVPCCHLFFGESTEYCGLSAIYYLGTVYKAAAWRMVSGDSLAGAAWPAYVV